MEGGATEGCFVPPPPARTLPTWQLVQQSGLKSNTPILPQRVVRTVRSGDKTCAVLVKKEPGLHQTFIKSALEAVNLRRKPLGAVTRANQLSRH